MRMRLLLIGTMVLAALPAGARPTYPKVLREHFGPGLAQKVQDCATCHAGPKEEPKFNAQLPKPHNLFGARLVTVGEELTRAKRSADLAARLDAIAREDADRDGASNEAEFLTGHFPGNAKDRPTPKDLARVPELRAKWARERGWVWQPFAPVRRPPVPQVRQPGWVRNPVDAFVAAERERHGLKPRPEAARETLLRRIYLDLIGLPPNRADLHAFLADRAPGAYERVVDRLLASPQYGERWARHWMDVWRYSDWDGYQAEVRNSQPHMWRWRDWIVRSLNEDRGYDRMVQEMLAGDELAPGDPAVLPATGFLVRNWYKFSRHETLTKMVEHTSKAFLGVTMNCARCHDHKFDAISMKEYYDFRAVFEPFDVRLDRVPGEADPNKSGIARVFDGDPKVETFLLLQGDDRKPDKTRPAQAAVPALLGGSFQAAPVSLPRTESVPDRKDFVLRETLAASEAAVEEARRTVEQAERGADVRSTEIARVRAASAAASHEALLAVLRVEALEEQTGKESAEWKEAALAATRAQREAAVLGGKLNLITASGEIEVAQRTHDQALRAAAGNAGEAAVKKNAAALDQARTRHKAAAEALASAEKAAAMPLTVAYTPRIAKTYPVVSTGRRLALARWITNRQNPLAARVAINHMWLRHFGLGLVPSVFDFGRNGRAPSHPALLDWLASELMDGSAWRMKAIHRLLVTSSTYRMDSTPDPAALAADPENRRIWRMSPRRVEAEAIRDSVLHVAGTLDPSAGGPDLSPDQGMTVPRRSLYFRTSMEKYVPFLAAFDQANVNECYQRSDSIVPQQALALANSPLALAASRTLAASLSREVGSADHAAFVGTAFLQILGRAPTREERLESERFLTQQTARLSSTTGLTPISAGAPAPVAAAADPKQRARESLVHALLNHHEFVTIP